MSKERSGIERLSAKLTAPGGVCVEEAARRAEAALALIRDRILLGLDEKIAALQAHLDAAELCAARLDAIYRTADEVFAEAGTFALAELSQAAQSLCALIAGCAPAAPSRARLTLHVQVLRALRRPELQGRPETRQAVLKALQDMSGAEATA